MSTNSYSQKRSLIRKSVCADMPEAKYRTSWLSVSEFVLSYSDETESIVEWITPGYNVGIPKTMDVEFKPVRLRSLLVDGEVVEKQHWSFGDIPMPAELWIYNGVFEWQLYKKYLRSIILKQSEDTSTHHEDNNHG